VADHSKHRSPWPASRRSTCVGVSTLSIHLHCLHDIVAIFSNFSPQMIERSCSSTEVFGMASHRTVSFEELPTASTPNSVVLAET
jgi:hypothetical protein